MVRQLWIGRTHFLQCQQTFLAAVNAGNEKETEQRDL